MPMGRFSKLTKTTEILTSILGPFFAQNDFSKKKKKMESIFFLEGGGVAVSFFWGGGESFDFNE